MTMSIQDLFAKLRAQDIHLAVDGERLRINAPKGALTPSLQEELLRRKPELLTWMRQMQRPAITPANRMPAMPLSISQERIWKSMQLVPDSARFNMYLAFRLNGVLDVAALEHSLNEIVRRHETLRTACCVVDGAPAQRISPFTPFTLHQEPCSDDAALHARLDALIGQPFDLCAGHLHRFSLLKLQEDAHVLVLVLHHIIADGWSWEVLLRELSALYSASRAGQPSPLPEPDIQYADFAVWQREWLSGAHVHELRTYWSSQLAPPLHSLALPGLPPAGNAAESRREAMLLDDGLAAGVKAFASCEGVTPFAVHLTAFYTALHALSAQDDLIICSPAACRTVTATEPLIGYFNNLLPLRVNAGGKTFRALLSDVQRTLQDALDHQELPFDAIAELPAAAHVSLARVVMSMQGDAGWTLELAGLHVSRIALFNQRAVFDVFLNVVERDNCVTALMEYRAGVLDAAHAQAMLNAFHAALHAMVEQPGQALKEWMAQAGAPARDMQRTRPVYAPPQTPAQKQLVALWEAHFDRAPIGIHDDFFALGGNSLLAYRLFGRIARDMNANLPLATLYQHTTIARLAAVIEQQPAHRAWTSLVAIQPRGSRPPFFGIHGQDGNVLFWRHIVENLDPEQPFYGIQAQGVDGYSKPLSRIEDMAALYLREMQQVQPAGPYYLGGFSMGGEIAFEMAQRIVAQGGQVNLLVMFDTGNPDRPVRAAAQPQVEQAAFTHAPEIQQPDKFSVLKRKLENHARRLSSMTLDDQARYITHDLRYRAGRARLKATSAAYRRLNRRLPDAILLPSLANAHMAAVLNYAPQPYAGCITLFRASATLAYSPLNSPMGWEPLALGGVDLHLFEATHRIVDPEYAVQVGRRLQMCLDAAQAQQA